MPLRLILHVYFYARHFYPLWLILNGKNFFSYKKQKQNLGPTQQRIVQDLQRDGIAVTSLEELFPDEDLLEKLRVYTKNHRAKAQVGAVKKFLDYMWDNFPDLDLQNPFIKLALHPKVLGVVNKYMGVYTQLLHFTLNVTRVVNPGTVPVQSQRWHRDPEDKKMCKMFIYLSDVDKGAGPFVYVKQSQFGGKYWRCFPMRPPVGRYPIAESLEKVVKNEDIRICQGRAGTVIFCDTAGLHRGGYATENERIMFTASYCSSVCPSSLMYGLPKNLEVDLNQLEPVSRYAIRTNYPLVTTRLFDLYKQIMSW